MNTIGRICAAFAVLCLLAGSVVAQIPGRFPPDVQVIIMPFPGGQWGVSAVYPKKVERSDAENRLRLLSQVSGWKADNVTWENKALERAMPNPSNPEAQPITAAPAIMSSLTFTTGAPVIDATGGTMEVEPFARAFRDLNRVHVTYLVPKNFVFKGLRHFSDANVDVDMLSGGQGAYTYIVQIKNHKLETLHLPRYETLKPGRKTQSADANGKTRLMGGGLVLLLALGAGGAVYAWAHRLGGR